MKCIILVKWDEIWKCQAYKLWSTHGLIQHHPNEVLILVYCKSSCEFCAYVAEHKTFHVCILHLTSLSLAKSVITFATSDWISYQPTTRTVISSRAFSRAASSAWNSLPRDSRVADSFRRFKRHYVLTFAHSHFTNPPRDRPHPQFVSHTSTYWHVVKNIYY